MENNIRYVSDITYKSELTPTPIGKVDFAIAQLVWGLNSPKQLTFAYTP